MAVGPDDGSPDSQVGWTVVFCTGPACESPLPIREDLAAAVRASPHGMLVGSACLFGPRSCPATGSAAAPVGPVLLAQLCSGADRDPLGPTVSLGPLRSRRDLAAVCGWLRNPASGVPPLVNPRIRRMTPRLN